MESTSLKECTPKPADDLEAELGHRDGIGYGLKAGSCLFGKRTSIEDEDEVHHFWRVSVIALLVYQGSWPP